MIGKVYRVLRPDLSTNYVVIFSKGDYFFNPVNSFSRIKDILKGKHLNRFGNYIQYVQKENYRLKYLSSSTAFIAKYPELFI